MYYLWSFQLDIFTWEMWKLIVSRVLKNSTIYLQLIVYCDLHYTQTKFTILWWAVHLIKTKWQHFINTMDHKIKCEHFLLQANIIKSLILILDHMSINGPQNSFPNNWVFPGILIFHVSIWDGIQSIWDGSTKIKGRISNWSSTKWSCWWAIMLAIILT